MKRAGSLVLALVLLWPAAGCSRSQESASPAREPKTAAAGETTPEPAEAADESRAAEREQMVRDQLAGRDVADERVLAAMRAVPRHALVPENVSQLAYADRPLPIGEGQTISQPYIVAKMTELAGVGPGDRVLEVGTGSGYQSAVLAQMGVEVYTIEIVRPLGERATRDLERLGYGDRIRARIGDGYRGWPEAAPFDAVIVTAAPPEIPKPLKEQLAVGGRLIIPVGDRHQELRVITRTEDGFEERATFPVRFVPMTGEARDKAQK